MNRICSVSDCPNKVIAKGFCESHYHRNKKYGNPLSGPLVGPEVPGSASYFYHNAVLPFKGDKCLLWPYALSASGYAKLKVKGVRTNLVHRMACEFRSGPPPSSDYEAAHTCGNGHKGCVNPVHLEWKTRLENQHDRKKHGTTGLGRKGNAKLCAEDVSFIRSNKGVLPAVDMAAHFGVRPATVLDVLRNRTWAQ